MGLFQRKKEEHRMAQPLYTVGQSHTLLVIGLGNVGVEYSKTRHNVGFLAVDRYHESHDDFSDWIEKKDLKCFISVGRVGSTRVLLVKPTTQMNLSGESVQKVMRFYKIAESDSIIVHDELDIDFGTIRTRIGGGSAGHNGIKSLLTHISGEFGRIRVGIGPKKPEQIDSADFVLKKFTKTEGEKLPKILKEVSALIDERTVGPLLDNSISV